MMVIMNSAGKFANTSTVQTHGGLKVNVRWGDLNYATLFEEKIHKRTYGDAFEELMSGIFIRATEHRTVTLSKE
jgi:hypothetical protein